MATVYLSEELMDWLRELDRQDRLDNVWRLLPWRFTRCASEHWMIH